MAALIRTAFLCASALCVVLQACGGDVGGGETSTVGGTGGSSGKRGRSGGASGSGAADGFGGTFGFGGDAGTGPGGSGTGGYGTGGYAGAYGTGGTYGVGGVNAGGVGGGSGCCTSDASCGTSSLCVSGRCMSKRDAQCWRDDQCGDFQRCMNAWVCPCGAPECPMDQGGHCSPICCTSDFDCGDLVYIPCVNNVCKPHAAEGCWSDSECAGSETCVGVSVCPCGADCDGPDRPGQCVGISVDGGIP